MSRSFWVRVLGVAALIVGVAVPPAYAEVVPTVDKQLSPDCKKKVIVDRPPSTKIPHQYMLLLVFKKHHGGKYFGHANSKEYGCIADVQTTFDAKLQREVLAASDSDLTMENCPNDCVYPYGKRAVTDDGTDPLNTDPNHTNKWGILSAIDSKPLSGGRHRRIEIWQIAVTDACHARKLYAYHTKHRHSLLSRALHKRDMHGEILVGYLVKGNGDEVSGPCEIPV